MQNPGPGSYASPVKTNNYKSSPTWKVGTAKRQSMADPEMSKIPGPGVYDQKHFSGEKMPSYSFGSGKRPDFGGNSKTPAPGSYGINSKAVEGPKYMMGLKLDNHSSIATEQKKTKSNPGPGNYNPDHTKTSKFYGSFSMKSRPIEKDVYRAPGPGAYTSSANNKIRAPSFGFGSASQREKLPPSTAPGPGNYHIPSMITHMPAYTGARSKTHAYI